MRLCASRLYWVVVIGLLAAVAVLAAFAVITILPEVRQGGFFQASPTPTPAVSAAATGTPGLVMNGAEIPDGAVCASCHLTDRGVIGLRAIPTIAHPLDGWRECTACHAADRLVNTAPGHSGIHASECLFCHRPGDLPAPLSRPHRDLQNEACLTCHGTTAPLPTDMAHRSQAVCWLCHRLPDTPPPVPAHQTAPGETDCLTCHVAGKVGSLPQDHRRRTGSECLLCHDVPLGSPAPATTGSLIAPLRTVPVRWPS